MGEGGRGGGREGFGSRTLPSAAVLKVKLRFVWNGITVQYPYKYTSRPLRITSIGRICWLWTHQRPRLAGYEVDSEDFMDFCRSGEDLFLTPDEAVIEAGAGRDQS